ncbi:hypothetical protein AAAW41_001696 [Cronobacter sakazakii]|nr:hypothetical protein [Cronobacter sakazakii]EMC4307335.1 hypothetical protein [Cronobacter sakazakii]
MTLGKERVEALASNILECHDVKPSEVKALAGLALLALRERAEPVTYADPHAFRNFQAGTANKGWMWAHPYAGLVPVFVEAPPAPVVPEWTNQQCLEFLAVAFRHAEIKGDFELDDLRLGVKMANAMTTGKEG